MDIVPNVSLLAVALSVFGGSLSAAKKYRAWIPSLLGVCVAAGVMAFVVYSAVRGLHSVHLPLWAVYTMTAVVFGVVVYIGVSIIYQIGRDDRNAAMLSDLLRGSEVQPPFRLKDLPAEWVAKWKAEHPRRFPFLPTDSSR
jgi:hypothetical protein